MKAKKLTSILTLTCLLAIECSLNAHVTRNRETVGNVTNASDAFLYQPENAVDEENFFTGKSGALDIQKKAIAAAHAKSLENKINDLTRQVKTTKDEVQKITKEHAQLRKENKENN